jgi:hypothetical protein
VINCASLGGRNLAAARSARFQPEHWEKFQPYQECGEVGDNKSEQDMQQYCVFQATTLKKRGGTPLIVEGIRGIPCIYASKGGVASPQNAVV